MGPVLHKRVAAGLETPTKKRERALDAATVAEPTLDSEDSSEAWETARGFENEKMDIRQIEADKMKTPYRSKKPYDGDGLDPDLPVHPQVWRLSIHGEEGVRACVEKRL